jgi:hypothetical protein
VTRVRESKQILYRLRRYGILRIWRGLAQAGTPHEYDCKPTERAATGSGGIRTHPLNPRGTASFLATLQGTLGVSEYLTTGLGSRDGTRSGSLLFGPNSLEVGFGESARR